MHTFPPALFLMGPTASGKTACAIHLLEQGLPVELISVDSALVFRDMNIGTAKPDAATLAHAPHHLIDLISPEASYSAAQFRQDALNIMADITARNKIPLLVGGTMLYFNALEKGLHDLPQADPALRIQIETQAAALGWPEMHRKLAALDPLTAQRLAPNDSQRIGRALEICQLSGRAMSTILAEAAPESPLPYRLIKIALVPSDRAVLHQRINSRFADMLEAGLIEEVRNLQQQYTLRPDLPSMRCVGYRQSWDYLAGHIDQDTLFATGCAATRQLAKRQLTWLRSMEQVATVDCLAPDCLHQVTTLVQQGLDH